MGTANVGVGRLPLGVAILAVLIGIFGFFILLAGLLVLLLGVGIGLATGASVFGTTGFVASLVILVIGAVILAVAFGLWDQELWALVLAIITLLVLGTVEFFAGAWLGFIIVAALLIYLVAVSSHFD
jgi:hypothetical protein